MHGRLLLMGSTVLYGAVLYKYIVQRHGQAHGT